MQVPTDVIVATPPRCVIVVGEFDGVHLRHRRLITNAQLRADRLGTPMFAIVLDTDSASPQLSSPRRRCELLVSCGVSFVHVISQSDDDELSDVVQRLRPIELLIDSESFAPLGLARFMAFLERRNIPHSEPSTPHDDMTTMSSRLIVEQVGSGNVEVAAKMIGRSFELVGVVELGTAQSHSNTFRSLQVRPDHRLVALPPGVYAGTIHVSRSRVAAVVSVGVGTRTDPIDVHTTDPIDTVSDDEISIDVITRISDPYPVSGSGRPVQRIDADVRRVSELCNQKNAESGSMP